MIFPGISEHEQSFCYLIVDNIKRHVTVWFHIWYWIQKNNLFYKKTTFSCTMIMCVCVCVCVSLKSAKRVVCFFLRMNVHLDDLTHSQDTPLFLQPVLAMGTDGVSRRWKWCHMTSDRWLFVVFMKGRGSERKAAVFLDVTVEPLHNTKFNLTGFWMGEGLALTHTHTFTLSTHTHAYIPVQIPCERMTDISSFALATPTSLTWLDLIGKSRHRSSGNRA